MSASPRDPAHGLQMLQAASMAFASSSTPTAPSSSTRTPPSPSASTLPPPSQPPSSLTALLNPAPPGDAPVLPSGFVLGKDGKLRKKRGRKPTPGLTEEDRRQARLLKNRRTAETSRRRKLAMLHQLTAERDQARSDAETLRKRNLFLTKRLAAARGLSLQQLLAEHPAVGFSDGHAKLPASPAEQSDVSRATSSAGSDTDSSLKKSWPRATSSFVS